MAGLFDLTNPIGPRRRNVFFSFHYADIMRVNNVRNCGKFKTTSETDIFYGDSKPSIEGYYDYSLWESRKLDGPEALKRMIREGVQRTSAICVLVGTQTYARRWVRYEIARSVIDGRGLLAVHLNNLTHHRDRCAHPLGPNPLDYIGIYKQPSALPLRPTYILYEYNAYNQWVPYQDYTQTFSLPRYLRDPQPGYLMPLSTGTQIYDFSTQNGYANIAGWIDTAASQVGY